MSRIFLGLGSNVGNREENITKAITLLSTNMKNLLLASLYESKAVGFTNQDNFLNTVVVGETPLTQEKLLIFVKDIEKRVGRIERFRWGPREIDIDILFYNELVERTEELEIPHPRLHERDFVLVPLMELSPDFIHPRFNKSIRKIFESLPIAARSILNSKHRALHNL